MSSASLVQNTLTSWASRWRATVSRLLAGAGRGRTFKFAVISIVLLGTWLRLRGYLIDVPTLWLDEAFWAMRILTKPIFMLR